MDESLVLLRQSGAVRDQVVTLTSLAVVDVLCLDLRSAPNLFPDARELPVGEPFRRTLERNTRLALAGNTEMGRAAWLAAALLGEFWGLYENNDRNQRLMAIINYNNDVSEYWEWSDEGFYPVDATNEAYKLGVNYLVYALTR